MAGGLQIAILSAALFSGLFFAERCLPLRDRTRSLWRRMVVNVVMSGLALGTGVLVVRPLASAALGLGEQRLGLLAFVSFPGAIEMAIGFLLLDLTFYYWHRLNHRVGFLWRFHNVHHIDPDLDVSTAFRFHAGEMVMSAAFRVLQVVLIGISPTGYLVYEAAFQANTLFHHSNSRLPIRLERWLNYLLVTPRMHGVHHSQVEEETNSNFSVVFSWWDRMHRTVILNIPQSAVVIGVPGYSQPEDNRLWNVLCMPFRPQRDYWRFADGTVSSRAPGELRASRARLAE
jgi:sterol desaturase/sphingolipid hydroxylase (fatty acid hydroxylase superfamily)